MTTIRIGRHWLFALAGGVLLAGFAFLLTQDSPAQGKKDKAKEKTETPKKEPKIEPPPSTFPKRVDLIDGAQGVSSHVTLIDEHITKGWKENKTFPSERCTDHEFIRRASLDIIGRIPTVEEIGRYMKQEPSKRRAWLINALLDGKEYDNGEQFANNFANLWTIHLITRTGSNAHHKEQLHEWIKDRLMGVPERTRKPKSESTESTSNAGGKEDKKEKSKEKTKAKSEGEPVARNAPDWSVVARRLIAGNGETKDNAAVNYLLHNLGEEIKQDQNKNGRWDMVPATSRTTRLFLGIRTQCVQCHDHPFNGEWGQHHFWGVNAFLRQVSSVSMITRDEKRPNPDAVKKKKMKGQVGQEEFKMEDRKDYNATNLIGYERRNTVYLFTDPSFLDGKKIPKAHQGTRREALANFIVSSPYFSKAYVNRMWGHFMGKSFTKDNPDDFGEHNPASHPELLDKLAEDWAKDYGHNPKTLVRWICNSQAYGLSSRANKWNDKMEDETLFARMLLKPMSPEQMFESLMIATANPGRKLEEKLTAKEAWLNKLVVNFGNDEGEEGNYTGTVVQALMLMNGQDINNAITDKEGVVANVITKRGASYASLPTAINDMFLHALGRPATQKEIFDMTTDKVARQPDGTEKWPMWAFRATTKVPPNPRTLPTTFWVNYYQDVMWALVNSNEFILNH